METIIIILALSIFLVYIIYETYFKKEYKIIKKFSINNGKNIEYYFTLKQKITGKIFKIQVNKETYDLHDFEDHIIIL